MFKKGNGNQRRNKEIALGMAAALIPGAEIVSVGENATKNGIVVGGEYYHVSAATSEKGMILDSAVMIDDLKPGWIPKWLWNATGKYGFGGWYIFRQFADGRIGIYFLDRDGVNLLINNCIHKRRIFATWREIYECSKEARIIGKSASGEEISGGERASA